MAERLEFEVPPARFPGAREELDALIETLHRTGALRLANDFIGRMDAVADVALNEAGADGGKNSLGAVLFLARVVAKVPAEDWVRLAEGLGGARRRPGKFSRRGRRRERWRCCGACARRRRGECWRRCWRWPDSAGRLSGKSRRRRRGGVESGKRSGSGGYPDGVSRDRPGVQASRASIVIGRSRKRRPVA